MKNEDNPDFFTAGIIDLTKFRPVFKNTPAAELDSEVKNGKTPSLRLTRETTVIQYFPLKSDTDYRLTFLVKGKDIASGNHPEKKQPLGARISIYFGRSYIQVYSLPGNKPETGTFDWRGGQFKFKTPKFKKGEKCSIQFVLIGSGTVWYDNVQITEMKNEKNLKLSIECDRPDGLYRDGDTIKFCIKAQRDGKGIPQNELIFVLYNEENREESVEPEQTGDGEYCIYRRGKKGTFLQVGVRLKQSKNGYVWSGAVVNHEEVRAAHTVPEDFDQFWKKYVDAVQKSTFTVDYRDIDKKLLTGCEGLVCKDVTIRSGCGLVATGYLIYPENAGEKSLPILATFSGASKVEAEIAPAQNAAKKGTLAFNLNFHGLSNQITVGEKAARQKALFGYQYKNADNPDLYPMKDIFMRVLLALKFLKSLPQWDGKEVMAYGGSLGGCQALVAAALDPQVTLCVAGAAAMSGHTNTPPGWPLLLKKMPEARKIAPYFDSASFATRIKAETIMTIGLIDRTCHPASTLSAYNNLPKDTPKRLVIVPQGDHNGHSPDRRGVYWYGSEEIQKRINQNRK